MCYPQPIKLAIASDVHLETLSKADYQERLSIINSVEADYLIMAGDITTLLRWGYDFNEIRPNVKKVIVVNGNHEYYHSDLSDEPLENFNHVHVLTVDNPFISDEINFFGDTLWTHVSSDKSEFVEGYMNDFRLINYGSRRVTVDTLNYFHRLQLDKLKESVASYEGCLNVIVTHHSPSFRGVDVKYTGHPANSAFHSNAIEEFEGLNIPLWIHGHTHDELDYVVDNGEYSTRVVCNPWGYKFEGNDLEIKYVIM